MNAPSIFGRITRGYAAGLALGLSLAASAVEPNAASQVNVNWTDPAKFTEVRYSHGFGRPDPEVWLAALSKSVTRNASRVLEAGQHLDVTFTDIKLAGQYEPWRGPGFSDVRIVKSIYPPRIDLTFTLTDASGAVLASGERDLRDPGFLTNSPLNTSDPYRFENRLLMDWMRREFSGKDS
jgi:hypothetical protein